MPSISAYQSNQSTTTVQINIAWVNNLAGKCGVDVYYSGGVIYSVTANGNTSASGISRTVSGLSPGTSYAVTASIYGISSGTVYGTSNFTMTTDSLAPFFPPYFPFFPFFPPSFPFFPPSFTPAPSWSGSGTDVVLGNAMEGTVYSDGVAASNATSYSITSGSFPSGLSFNTSTGAVTGTPANGTAGTYNLTFTATGAGGSTTSGTITLTVVKETGQLFVYNSTTSQWVKATMNTFSDIGGTPTPAKNTVYVYNSTTSQWEISQG